MNSIGRITRGVCAQRDADRLESRDPARRCGRRSSLKLLHDIGERVLHHPALPLPAIFHVASPHPTVYHAPPRASHPRKIRSRAVSPLAVPREAPQNDSISDTLAGDEQDGSYQGGWPRVLHVDADVDAALVLATLLMPEVRVTHVSTLAQARALIDDVRFSLIVLDPDLADGDGASLLPSVSNTPVLFYAEHNPAWCSQSNIFLLKHQTSYRQLLATVTGLLTLTPGPALG